MRGNFQHPGNSNCIAVNVMVQNCPGLHGAPSNLHPGFHNNWQNGMRQNGPPRLSLQNMQQRPGGPLPGPRFQVPPPPRLGPPPPGLLSPPRFGLPQRCWTPSLFIPGFMPRQQGTPIQDPPASGQGGIETRSYSPSRQKQSQETDYRDRSRDREREREKDKERYYTDSYARGRSRSRDRERDREYREHSRGNGLSRQNVRRRMKSPVISNTISIVSSKSRYYEDRYRDRERNRERKGTQKDSDRNKELNREREHKSGLVPPIRLIAPPVGSPPRWWMSQLFIPGFMPHQQGMAEQDPPAPGQGEIETRSYGPSRRKRLHKRDYKEGSLDREWERERGRERYYADSFARERSRSRDREQDEEFRERTRENCLTRQNAPARMKSALISDTISIVSSKSRYYEDIYRGRERDRKREITQKELDREQQHSPRFVPPSRWSMPRLIIPGFTPHQQGMPLQYTGTHGQDGVGKMSYDPSRWERSHIRDYKHRSHANEREQERDKARYYARERSRSRDRERDSKYRQRSRENGSAR